MGIKKGDDVMETSAKFDKLLAQLGKEKKSYAQWQSERYPVRAERPPYRNSNYVNNTRKGD